MKLIRSLVIFVAALVLLAVAKFPPESLNIRKFSVAGQTGDFGTGLSVGLARQIVSTVDHPVFFTAVNAVPPSLGLIKISGDTTELTASKPLTTQLSGLNLGTLKIEGVAQGQKGFLWLAESSLPALLEVEPSETRIIQALLPGAGLPEVIKTRQSFPSGVTISPNGKVYAIFSTVSEKSGDREFQIIEFDPRLVNSRALAYPLAENAAGEITLVSNIQAVGNRKFLAVESGPGQAGATLNQLVLLDISTSAREVLVDLNALGLDSEKITGLSLLMDRKTVALKTAAEIWLMTLPESLSDRDPANRLVWIAFSALILLGVVWLWLRAGTGRTDNGELQYDKAS